MSRLDALLESLGDRRRRLLDHPVYEAIDSPRALCIFMEHHVFAVWDFMTLLKALQRCLTCVEVPWTPTGDRLGRRLINEIVLAEESDDDGRGGFASHFETYLDAMQQAGAGLGPISSLIDGLAIGRPAVLAFDRAGMPPSALEFVRSTWRVVESGSAPSIASAFTIGREDLIPGLFGGLVARLDDHEGGRLGIFRRYLGRHVHLDGDEHGPMARQMLSALCRTEADWSVAEESARQALDARLALWDGIGRAIRTAPAIGPGSGSGAFPLGDPRPQ